MKTREFARALWAFAEIADYGRAEDLHLLATFFEKGGNETLLARFKRITPSNTHPASLKCSLTAIQSALKAAGAKRQARLVGEFLKFCGGRPGGTMEHFLRDIARSPSIPANIVPSSKKIDHRLAASILDRLKAPSFDPEATTALIQQLSNRAVVGTATLAFIAHAYLNGGHAFRDRKTAISSIAKRYAANASTRVQTLEATG